ncbi:MAG: YraN family protein [Propionibacteriaceae bacterium]|nr:YraN family protein [Propionibacteriaceae bacterium]
MLVGARGEELAAGYVTGLGWRVLDRNWRAGRLGELDLVALEPGAGHAGVVVFCEVKTRTGLGFGRPLEAVTRAKLVRLRRLALAWLGAHQVRAAACRVDAIGVLLRPGLEPSFDHVRGAEL